MQHANTALPFATFSADGIPHTDLYRQLTTGQAADFLNIPKRNLELMRAEGKGPLFVRFSPRNIRYRLIDLIRYQERQLRQSTLNVRGAVTPDASGRAG